jgi:hypothetical protein
VTVEGVAGSSGPEATAGWLALATSSQGYPEAFEL